MEAEAVGPSLLTTQEAATMLRALPRTLARWRKAGTGPRPIRLPNRQYRYPLAEVEKWLQGLETSRIALYSEDL